MFLRKTTVGSPLSPFRLGLLVTAGMAIMATATGQALVIDDFDSSGGVVADTIDNDRAATTTAVGSENLLGGERDYQAVLTDFSSQFDRVVITAGATSGSQSLALHSQDAGASGYSLLSYDGVDGTGDALDFTGLGGIDLLADDRNAFQLELSLSDRGAPVTVFVFTDEHHWSWLTGASPVAQQITDDSVYLQLDYADFVAGTSPVTLANGDPISQLPGVAMGGADFSDVGALALLFDGSDQAGFDIGLNQFAANKVPLPGTLMLMLFAIMGFQLRGRADEPAEESKPI